MTTLLAIDTALLTLGFAPGAPSETAATIDAECAAESQCECCGTIGLDYLPYRKGTRYVALAICRACGAWEEF